MRFLHMGFAAKSEGAVDRFYRDLCGLSEVKRFTVSAELMDSLFGLARETEAVVFAAGDATLEVFLVDDAPPLPAPAHGALGVDDVEAFAARAREAGFPVTVAPKGDGTVTFVSDADGNRFEIKPL